MSYLTIKSTLGCLLTVLWFLAFMMCATENIHPLLAISVGAILATLTSAYTITFKKQ